MKPNVFRQSGLVLCIALSANVQMLGAFFGFAPQETARCICSSHTQQRTHAPLETRTVSARGCEPVSAWERTSRARVFIGESSRQWRVPEALRWALPARSLPPLLLTLQTEHVCLQI